VVEWGHDPVHGDVIILGKCDYRMYVLSRSLEGYSLEEGRYKCFDLYSVLPDEDTKFLACFSKKDKDWFLYIVPEVAIKLYKRENNNE
jgi:hypothetical protein